MGHLTMGLHWERSLEKSIFSDLSKAIPQGEHRLDRESAVQTTPRAEKHCFEMLGFRM